MANQSSKVGLIMQLVVVFSILLLVVQVSYAWDCNTDCNKNFTNPFDRGACHTWKTANCSGIVQEIFYCRTLINCDPNQFEINQAIIVAKRSGIIHNRDECNRFAENIIQEIRTNYGSSIPFFEAFATRGRSQANDSCNYQFSDIRNEENTQSRWKHGNNNSVSCDAFCSGSQWSGWSGRCIKGYDNKHNMEISCGGGVSGLSDVKCLCVPY